MVGDDVIELLADVEHERWAGWMRYSLDKMTTENIARWRGQMKTPYAELPEHSKESDRVEARKTVQALKDAGLVIVPRVPSEAMVEVAGPAIDGYFNGTKDAPFEGSVVALYRAMIAAHTEES